MTDEELFYKLEPDGCWHEFDHFGEWNIEQSKCKKCGFKTNHYYFMEANPDFSTWEGFGFLWERAIGKDWWLMFEVDVLLRRGIMQFIQPTRFRDALKEYLKGEGR